MEVVVRPWPQPVMECLLAFGAVQLVVGMYYIRVYKPLVCMYVCMYIVVGAVNIITVSSTSLPYYSGSVELAMWLLQNANRFDVVYSASPR